MDPADCPTWEYSSHPRCHEILTLRISEVISGLLRGAIDTLSVASDTRKVHQHIFCELAPLEYSYYAGHYRGEDFRCLRFCRVGIASDPRVGANPHSVAFLTQELARKIDVGLSALDANLQLTPKERLHCIVALACHIFVAFLTIHPYVNGNGHAGRLIVWSIMGRYDYWPRRWTVDPRPQDPPYSELIRRCRGGDPLPLERYLLQTLIG